MHGPAPINARRTGWMACGLAAAMALWSVAPRAGAATPSFPRKPIKVIVYTAPGGLLDMMARKFADVAKAYTDATFVVENKTGAGGIVAIEKVLQMPADGYTLCACTKSMIAKVVSANRLSYVDELDWAGLLVKDRECIITRHGGALQDWQMLRADAAQRTGPQIWLGPATGGQDHVFAMKCWDAFGISAEWVPFSSGSEALMSLLGDQGTAYVGSPRDTKGNSDLRAIAVSSSQRLPKFPQTPTFGELGAPELDNEFMWRGFALKQNGPPEVRRWYDELFRKITADKQWRAFWEESGTEVVYEDQAHFTEVVRRDSEEFQRYMQRLGMIQSNGPATGDTARRPRWVWSLPWAVMLAAIWLTWRQYASGQVQRLGHSVIPALILVAALSCFVQTLSFPRGTGSVGPAAVPKLWAVMLVPLCIYTYFASLGEPIEHHKRAWRTDLVWWFVGLMSLYTIGTVVLGYYLSTAGFLLSAMYLLGLHDRRTAVWVTGGWLLFAGIAFAGLLYVPLPTGLLIERLLRGG